MEYNLSININYKDGHTLPHVSVHAHKWEGEEHVAFATLLEKRVYCPVPLSEGGMYAWAIASLRNVLLQLDDAMAASIAAGPEKVTLNWKETKKS